MDDETKTYILDELTRLRAELAKERAARLALERKLRMAGVLASTEPLPYEREAARAAGR